MANFNMVILLLFSVKGGPWLNWPNGRYATAHKLFQIIKQSSVIVSSAEHSFSTLRRIKTWLRIRMTQDRLLGLALLNEHRHTSKCIIFCN